MAVSHTVVYDTSENRRTRHRKPQLHGISEEPGVPLGQTTGILAHESLAGERQSRMTRAAERPSLVRLTDQA